MDTGQATIDNPGVASQLIGVLLSDKFVPSVKDKQAYCIIHVLRWGEPDTTTEKQDIQAQNWYLYSTLRSTKAGWTQEDFTKNKRLLGSHRVYIIYIHLNLAAGSALYIPSYRLTVTKKVPANIQHLLTLFQAFAPAATGGSA